MGAEVTDPALLAQLNGEVTDPALLAQLNGTPPPQQTPSMVSQLGRGAGLSARALIQGAAGLPASVADFGHSLYQLGTSAPARAATWEAMKHPSHWLDMDPNAPSQQFSRGLDPYLPKPQTTAEKVMSIGLGAEGGALMPQVPIPGAKAPEGFVSPKDAATQRTADSLQRYKDNGLVVPPSTTNPTLGNRFMETVSGKEATQNSARAINQTGRNALVAKDLGLSPEMLTPEAVAALKKEAGQTWDAARAIPNIKTDSQYLNDLVDVTKQSSGANASFPGAKNPDVEKLIDTYTQPQFTGDAGVSAMKMLRQKASDAYRQGDAEMGMAYKGIANAIDKQLERGANQLGGPFTGLVQKLRQARTVYAQASTAEDVMDPAGNISGPKLAAAWNRDEPLTGGMKLAAEHAASYPKANLPANSSNVSHVNALTVPLAAMEGYHLGGWKGGLAAGVLPFARGGARSYLLSGMGQSGAIPKTAESYTQMLAKALANPTIATGGANQ